MKKTSSIFLFLFFLILVPEVLAASVCKTTRVNIQNNSSFDCVLTDYIRNDKKEPSPVIFKNQSISFDLANHSSGKGLVLRYQCGSEASVLLYFFQKLHSTGSGYYFTNQLDKSTTNMDVQLKKQNGECNLFTPSSPDLWFISIENKKLN